MLVLLPLHLSHSLGLQAAEHKGEHSVFMLPKAIPGYQKKRKMSVQGISPAFPVPGCPPQTTIPHQEPGSGFFKHRSRGQTRERQ